MVIKLTVQTAGGPPRLVRDLLAYPRSTTRPTPPDVPPPYSDDFKEACMVVTDSPKASATLSRRLLQAVLRDRARVKKGKLDDEIDEAIASGGVPAPLAEQLHAVRRIGNHAAHPEKSVSTGLILDVEPGEAEWLLDVLEGVLDLYFVQPAVAQRRKDSLNQKLQAAGKTPMP